MVTIRKLIRDLETYFKVYGDVPCYVAIGNDLSPMNASLVGDIVTKADEEDANVEAKMTVCILADREAYAEGARSEDNIDPPST